MSSRTCIVVLLGVLLSGASATITFERTWSIDSGNDAAYCTEQTADGGYILTAESQDSAHQMAGALLKADSLGNLEWWRQYYSPTNSGAGGGELSQPASRSRLRRNAT